MVNSNSNYTRRNMQTNFKKVKEFHNRFRIQSSGTPNLENEELIQLRVDLIDEEFSELKEAISKRDIVGVADALTDILYVTYGAGDVFGIDLDECFNDVHSSNMSKLDENGDPIFRDDGKVLKGPNYRPPNLEKIIFKKG